MRILLLADEPDVRLWDHLDKRLLEGLDLVISCGDLPGEYLSFLTCFTNAPILYVHGNHDARYESKPPEGCICIEDRVVLCKGLRIVGLGGSMRYKPGPHQYTDKEMQKRAKKLRHALRRSKGFDILVAHSPMKGVGDSGDLAHRGFQTFVDMVEKYRPRWFVHGHVHQSYDFRFKRERDYQDTRIINAYVSHIIEIDAPQPPEKARVRKKNIVE